MEIFSDDHKMIEFARTKTNLVILLNRTSFYKVAIIVFLNNYNRLNIFNVRNI